MTNRAQAFIFYNVYCLEQKAYLRPAQIILSNFIKVGVMTKNIKIRGVYVVRKSYLSSIKD